MIQLELNFMFPAYLDETRVDFPAVQFDVVKRYGNGSADVRLTGERPAVEEYVLEYNSGDAEDTVYHMTLATEVQA